VGCTACTEPQCLYKGALYFLHFRSCVALVRLEVSRKHVFLLWFFSLLPFCWKFLCLNMTKQVVVFANNTYFASVHWELFYLISFWNRQWSLRQKSWPSKVSLFLGNLNDRYVWNGGKLALEMQARGNWWIGEKKRGRRIGKEKREKWMWAVWYFLAWSHVALLQLFLHPFLHFIFVCYFFPNIFPFFSVIY